VESFLLFSSLEGEVRVMTAAEVRWGRLVGQLGGPLIEASFVVCACVCVFLFYHVLLTLPYHEQYYWC
jgi:hypothetical protein